MRREASAKCTGLHSRFQRSRLIEEPPLGSCHRHLPKGPLGDQVGLQDTGSGEGALLNNAAEGEGGK